MPGSPQPAPQPLVIEINTRCWLRELAARHSQPIVLSNVPISEFQLWTRRGFTHIWLMGVWTTGPRSRNVFLSHPDTPVRLRRQPQESVEVPGSPYAIGAYEVPQTLGGDDGLRQFRERLHHHGLNLLLDFVPNHVGLDHPWLIEHPEFFVQSPEPIPGTFRQQTRVGVRWMAHGKDPYFPPWADTAQLDLRSGPAQAALIDQLGRVAERCDGVRCDMAMLVLTDVFSRNWAHLPCPAPAAPVEFWSAAIAAVRRPGFLFLAEAYWDLEERLQSLGFDFTYDKRVTDLLVERRPRELQQHLISKGDGFISRSAHFLENHDEPRIASRLSLAEHQAAALLILGLPGMRLLHEGQLEGAQLRTPIHLAQRGIETTDPAILNVYENLFAALARTSVGRAHGQLLHPLAKPRDDEAVDTHRDVIAIQWQHEHEQDACDLVVVNLAGQHASCRIRPQLETPAGHEWEVTDALDIDFLVAAGSRLLEFGLPLDLQPHAVHIFQISRKV